MRSCKATQASSFDVRQGFEGCTPLGLYHCFFRILLRNPEKLHGFIRVVLGYILGGGGLGYNSGARHPRSLGREDALPFSRGPPGLIPSPNIKPPTPPP